MDRKPGLQVHLALPRRASSEPPSFARLLEFLAAHPLARGLRPKGRLGWYFGAMDNPFAAYNLELELSVAPKAHRRGRQVVSA